MKLVVFAHTPPPFHGQSYMVQLMVNGLRDIEVFHVNARLSDDLQAVGKFRLAKVFRLLRYCAAALFYRFFHHADAIYYIPASGVRAAVYRDWIVMVLCRPFFRRIVFHWHASGLSDWVCNQASLFEQRVTRKLLTSADLSIVLARNIAADAESFRPKRLSIVPNGIPDPCAEFVARVLPERRARFSARINALLGGTNSEIVYRVLFLGNCIREKGIFETAEAIHIGNRSLKDRQLPVRLHLTVAGEFAIADDRRVFENIMRESSGMIQWLGFVSAAEKQSLLRESDCLCFPTYYPAEGQPVSLIEAMASGLAIVATNWRAIPEMLPPNISTVPIRDANAVALALTDQLNVDFSETMRRNFLERFSLETHLRNLNETLQSVA